MNAVDARAAALVQKLCGAFVGDEHALFNKAMGRQARARLNVEDAAVGVEKDLGLWNFEVDRSAFHTSGMQTFKHLHDVVKARSETFELAHDPRVLFDKGLHLLVGQASLAEHESLVELKIHHFPFAIDDTFANKAGSFLKRVERTHPVGENFGEHGHHVIGKVHTGGLLKSFAIEGGTGFYEKRHVGNSHPKTDVAIVVGLSADRIVEVTGIASVDGHERQVTDVLA